MTYKEALLKTLRSLATVVMVAVGSIALGMVGGFLVIRGYFVIAAAYYALLFCGAVAYEARWLQRWSR